MGLEDILKSDKVKNHHDDWYGLGRLLETLKGNLYILRQIDGFPFGLFTTIYGDSFWYLVRRALLESTIVTLYAIAVDDKRSYHNFDKFVERIKNEYSLTNQTAQNDINVHITNYKQNISPVRRKINLIRNNFVAHISDKATDVVISPDEMDEILAKCYELLVILSFGYYTTQTPLDYPPRISSSFTDIEYLLGFVASRSDYLREEEAEHLKIIHKERLNNLNHDQRLLVDKWDERLKQMGIKK